MPKEVSFLFSQTILIFKLPGNHFVITVEALMSGHPCHVKKVSLTRAGCFWNVKMQSLYGSWEQWCFVRVDVSRAVRLWECPLAEHPLYFRLPKCKFEKKSSQEHCLWVMCSVSTPLLKKIKFIPPKKIPWVAKPRKSFAAACHLFSWVPMQSH